MYNISGVPGLIYNWGMNEIRSINIWVWMAQLCQPYVHKLIQLDHYVHTCTAIRIYKMISYIKTETDYICQSSILFYSVLTLWCLCNKCHYSIEYKGYSPMKMNSWSLLILKWTTLTVMCPKDFLLLLCMVIMIHVWSCNQFQHDEHNDCQS